MIDLNGDWYNQLNSKMTIQVSGKNITGVYESKVGDVEGTYDLVGKADIDSDDSQAIGWVVLWHNDFRNSDSITSWSGEARIIDGVETIVTTWLLTKESDKEDMWKSTEINKDIFTRTPPTTDVNATQKLGVNPSFPV